jgi:hypothetical protein
LARGDIAVISEELDELLYAFQVNLDRKSEAYRKLVSPGAMGILS